MGFGVSVKSEIQARCVSVMDFHVAVVLVLTGYIPGDSRALPSRPSLLAGVRARGLWSKPRVGKRRFVRTLICPGVFSKLKLSVIIRIIIIDFYRLFFVVSFCFGFFFLLKKSRCAFN